MAEDKKNLFDKIAASLSGKDKKESSEAEALRKVKAAAQQAREESASEKAARLRQEAEQRLAEELAEAERAAAEAKAAADRAAAMARAPGQGLPSQEPVEESASQAQRGRVQGSGLTIHRDHSLQAEEVGVLEQGQEVPVYEIWTDGKDSWARIGDDQWAAAFLNGVTQIKIEM